VPDIPIQDVRVLDPCLGDQHQRFSGPHQLSDFLAIPLCPASQVQLIDPDNDIPNPHYYVIAVMRGSDVQFIRQAMQKIRIAALIAWRLDEHHVQSLLQWPVHVFIGKPDLGQFSKIISRPYDVASERAQRATEIAMSRRLTLIEDRIMAWAGSSAQPSSNGTIPGSD